MSMEYQRLLITGFEPFGGESANSSWEAVSALPDTVGKWKLTKKQLPVVFGKAAECAVRCADAVLADAILCVGQAGGRSTVTPEYVAVNLRHACVPDNEGNAPKELPVVSEAPDGMFSTVPVMKMAAAIQTAGLKGAVSFSAGTFVCNDTLFSLLWNYRNSCKMIGFIHVPYMPEQVRDNTPCMALEDICRSLEAAIACM